MFFKKNNSATPVNFDENFDLDVIKDKISKNKQNMLEEDIKRGNQLSEKDGFNQEQIDAIKNGLQKGISFDLLAHPEYEALKIKALIEAFEIGATENMLYELSQLNFMQIKWSIIPAIKREFEIQQVQQMNQMDLDDMKLPQPIDDQKLNKQLMLLGYMYDCLVNGNNYVLDAHNKSSKTDDIYERFIISFSGKTTSSDYQLKRTCLSIGYLTDLKQLLMFTVDTNKYKDGSFIMYSLKDRSRREADLNSPELDIFYEKTDGNVKFQTLEDKLDFYGNQITQERQQALEARMNKNKNRF